MTFCNPAFPMKPIPLIFLTAVATASPAYSQGLDFPAFARDFRPEARFENIPATNASVLQCYVFQTSAGVGYQVEVSNDMLHWTATDEIYGLGHEYVVTMREFTPAPPPEPGASPSPSPSAPTKCVSIRMQPATGMAGGTVVAWPSLDNGSSVVVKIDGALDAGWSSIPLYANRFGDYDFSSGIRLWPPLRRWKILCSALPIPPCWPRWKRAYLQ
jgi:hypothetical protein